MRIPLSSRFREQISAIIDKETSKWLGFLRVDLLNPQTDGLALLRGDRIFTMQLRNEYVIGKVEKGFDFNSTSTSRKVRIQSPVLSRYNSRQLLGELIRLGFTSGKHIEFAGVSKRSNDQDFADITLVVEETRQLLVQRPILLEGERIIVTIPSRGTGPNLSPDALTTTLILKGLPLDKSQVQISAAVHRLLGARNVTSITYHRA